MVLALVVVACTATGAPSGAAPTSVDCAKLASIGVKTCPPNHPHLSSPKLINDTDGRVSSSAFGAYVRGYLRNEAYQTFAINTNQPAMLHADILSDRNAVPLSFGPDLQSLSQAASEKGHLTGIGPVLTSLRLVILPSNIQDGIRAAGYRPSRLGWVATYGGPATYFIIAGPQFTILQSVSGQSPPYLDLTWGTYQSTTALGPIWQIYGDTKCSVDPLWEAFCQQ